MSYEPPIHCIYCGSENFNLLLTHNNRRLKCKVFIYLCKKCKKRFNKYSKEMYNHKGNLLKRKKLCHHCGEKLDSDTERKIGICLQCVSIVKERHYSELGLQDLLVYMIGE